VGRLNHMNLILGILLLAIGALLVPQWGTAGAQEATPTPERPTEPPAEAIHCVRPFPDRTNPALALPSSPEVSLDESSGQGRIAIPATPAGATCYAIFRFPSETNPIAFQWSPDGITAPAVIIDETPFPFAGRYCYQIFFGNREGVSPRSEVCLDVTESVAPAPPPAPTPAHIPPIGAGGAPAAPSVGTGTQVGAASSLWLWIAVATSGLALAVGGLVLRRPTAR
jgi:hypothetical protein